MTRGTELEQVRHEGKRVRTASLDVRALASLHAFPRVGFVVPRYRHSAVARNRVKRRLRELVRLDMLSVLEGLPPHDVVVRALPAAYQRDYA
ncbi:MAG: ribonuclease P protein component, partial [Gemmatimonadaceae bacterium]|nr:ribonuclease P protein component [Gemmatimonadaceae bacterium]